MSHDSMNGKQKFCVMPFINLHVAPDGAVAPCCEFEGTIGHLSSSTLAELWTSAELDDVRERFSNDQRVDACWKCFDREADEKRSFRQEMNELFSDWHQDLQAADQGRLNPLQSPRTLDVRFSNLCNFKCRSCWHGASSKWFSDAKTLGLTVADTAEVRSFESSETLLSQMSGWINDIETIVFAGGEPLITEEHYRLLSALLDAGRSDVKLRYHSNMSATGLGEWSVLDLWQQFDSVHVQASVDDIGARGALIRHGFDWSTFVSNIQQLRSVCPHLSLEYGITVSALNITRLENLFEALARECGAVPSQFFLHSLQVPVFMRTQVLPGKLKREIASSLRDHIKNTIAADGSPDASHFSSRIEGVVSYMMAQDLTDELPNLARRMDQLDNLRHESSADILPELEVALKRGRNIRGLAYRLKNKGKRLLGPGRPF